MLVVEDEPEDQLLYEKYLKGSDFQAIPARTLRRGAPGCSPACRPRAIILDILLGGEDSWGFLAEVKSRPALREIPVIVATTVEDQAKGLALGADAYGVKPVGARLAPAASSVTGCWGRSPGAGPWSSTTTRSFATWSASGSTHFEIAEAATGEDGLIRLGARRRTSSSWTW